MAPGRQDTCPCGFLWLKDKQGDGYTCAGGHHRINGSGETPAETKWRMSQKADAAQKVAERAYEQGRAEARAREKERVRIRAAPPATNSPSWPVQETDADRERRESREQELKGLRERQLRQDKAIPEPPRATRQQTRSTPTAAKVEAELAKARQQKQKVTIQVNQKEPQQRLQKSIDAQAAEERAAAWAPINATKRAGPATPTPSFNRPRALPAPDPAPIIEPMPWTSMPSAKPTREREPELVRPRQGTPKEREKMPWE